MTEQPDGKRLAAVAQASYYLVTGVWPLLHMRSFEWLTGPKVDRWLVKSVGAQFAVVGSAIGLAARRRRMTPEIELLGIGTAAAFSAIDLIFVARRRISPIYLLDALAQIALIARWSAESPHRSAKED